jgi:hypothetical protein
MIIPYECPHCGAEISAEVTAAGAEGTCRKCNESSPVPSVGLIAGVTIGNGFVIEEKLGAGSMGDIYLARQASMNRQVLIKVLSGLDSADEETCARFNREVNLPATLQHPNLLSAIDAGEDNNVHYLVTEYAKGEDLESFLSRRGALDEKEALGLLTGVGEVLRYAWEEKKVLHRNVKPSNMLVTEAGKCLLSDLGIAKSLEEDSNVGLTGAGFTVGTPEYMSPEQVTGEEDLDFRSDMYSLGIVLYQAVTGSLPFTDASPILVMNLQMDAEPEPPRARNNQVSDPCSQLILRMLAKDKEKRFPSWQALIAECNAVAEGKAAGAGPGAAAAPAAAEPSPAPRKRKKKKQQRPAKGGQAGQRLSSAEVEQIAAKVYGKSPLQKFVLYGLSIAIPIALVYYFGIRQSGSKKAAPPTPQLVTDTASGAGQGAVVPPSAARATAPAEKTKAPPAAATGLEEMFNYAMGYAKANPDAYDEAIAKLEKVHADATGTVWALKSEEAIEDLQAQKKRAIAALLKRLGEEAAAKAATDGVDAAAAIYTEYRGALASATAADRQAAAADLRRKLLVSAAERQQASASTAKQLEALQLQVAKALLAGKTRAANGLVQKARMLPELKPLREQFAALTSAIEAVVTREELIAAAYQAEVGKTVTLRLAAGGELKIAIEKASNGGISGRIAVEHGTLGKSLKMRDLHPREHIDRLGSSARPPELILAGILAVRAKDRERALQLFTKAGAPLGPVFVRALAE